MGKFWLSYQIHLQLLVYPYQPYLQALINFLMSCFIISRLHDPSYNQVGNSIWPSSINYILLIISIKLITLTIYYRFFTTNSLSYPYLQRDFVFQSVETRIVMKPIDYINEIYRSNHSQNLADVYSISMVIIQSKLIDNRKAIESQKIEDSV